MKKLKYGKPKLIKIEKDVKDLKRTINKELKYRDEYTSGALPAIPNTGNFLLLNSLAQGDSATTRTGNGVMDRSFEIKFQVAFNSASAVGQQNLRVLLIRDKQANGSLPATANTVLQQTWWQSAKNDANSDRFKILMDKCIGVSSSGPETINFKKYIRVKTQTRYNGNAGTVADIVTGSYFLLMISDQAANGPVVQYYIRFRYTDI